VQGEGGIHVASDAWLRELADLCREFDILLIVDDIQVGNGRTGTFFSFERAGIVPDMVALSKSIGAGLPLAILLMRPELDQWQPGEHTGTFRGNNLAFVAATQALTYWEDDALAREIEHKGRIMASALEALPGKHPELQIDVRGVGMIWGVEFGIPGLAAQVSREAFRRNLVIELAGAKNEVVKFLPPLTIDEETLREGLGIIQDVVAGLAARRDQVLHAGAAR